MGTLRDVVLSCSILVALNAAFYQLWLKEFLDVTVGVGRVIRKIEEFPYECRRIEHPTLEACEDLWLDDDARVLYAACAGTQHRLGWNMATDRLNHSSRRPQGSEMIALDVDQPGPDGAFNPRLIKPIGYIGAAGYASLDLLGFDVEVVDSSTLRFYFVNDRPPVDYRNNYIDATETGANSTIEVFEYTKGSFEMKHLRTVFSPYIFTPNNVAAVGDGAFIVSNDHSKRVGFRRKLDPYIGGGSLTYCAASNICHRALPESLKFPNGLARGADGLIYVPSSIDGKIRVYKLDRTGKMLLQVAAIEARMPLDNLAADANGDIWVPGFPHFSSLMKWMENPLEKPNKITVLKISKRGGWHKDNVLEYTVKTMLEDVDARVVTSITTVRHDVKTGRLFMGGVFNPYLVVCEPK